jgi:DNA-directed RNA polymerase subunit RPC12/RpoP
MPAQPEPAAAPPPVPPAEAQAQPVGRVPAPHPGEAAHSVVEYKCPKCGGVVTFDAPSGKMKCGYCGSYFEPAEFTTDAAVAAQPEAETVAPAGEEWTEDEKAHLRQYTCPSCGGQILTDVTTAATHCPYCDSPTILPSQLTGARRPDAVLPFKVTKDQVTEALTGHLKGKRLAPKQFRAKSKIDSVVGLYVPFWLFDTQLAGDITFSAKRVTTWSDSRNMYTKTDTYRVRRAGTAVYQGVPVDAATKIDNDYTEAIEPFDYDAAVEYQPTYLLGYLAQTYDADADECRPRAHQRMAAALRESFAASVRAYDSFSVEGERIKVTGENVHYALMPVWLLNTIYDGKTWTFAMNGQTGEFVGELPMAWSQLWKWFFALFAAIGLAVSVLAYVLLGVVG